MWVANDTIGAYGGGTAKGKRKAMTLADLDRSEPELDRPALLLLAEPDGELRERFKMVLAALGGRCRAEAQERNAKFTCF